MKFKTRNMLFYFSLSIIIIFTFSKASVRKDIKNIAVVDELKSYYEANCSNLYKVRYVLKYLPDFLEKRGVYSCPDWVIDLAENSLYTEYGPLITESIKLIGIYKLDGYTDRLYELFLVASRDYANSSTVMRFAIIRTLSQIGGDYEKIKLIELFNAFPKDFIGFTEFGFLAHKVASLGTVPAGGDKVKDTQNAAYIVKTDIELSKLDPGKYEDKAQHMYFSNLKSDLIKISNNGLLLEKGENK